MSGKRMRHNEPEQLRIMRIRLFTLMIVMKISMVGRMLLVLVVMRATCPTLEAFSVIFGEIEELRLTIFGRTG